MTTGGKGEYKTPFGVIEFTHTKRRVSDIISCTVDVGRHLRIASRKAAWRDLRRVGRNTDLVDVGAICRLIVRTSPGWCSGRCKTAV